MTTCTFWKSYIQAHVQRMNFTEEKMKKVVVLIAQGFEEIEALSPVDYLRRAKADVVLAATATEGKTVTASHKVSVNCDTTLDEVLGEATLPDAVVIPGGLPGATNIAGCKAALTFIERMFDAGKIVAAICASPALVLGKTKVLQGKDWTCYPQMEENVSPELQKRHKTAPFVTDGNVVTARGAGAAEQFSMELVRLLCGESERDRIAKATVQR